MTCKSIHQTIMKEHPELLYLIFFEFFQKFSLFGSQAIMFLFLKHELRFKLHNAMGIYHMYVGLSYMVPVFGTILADLYVNKMASIITISTFTLIGNLLIILASVALSGAYMELLPYVFENAVTFATVGLVMRALGVGGIREVALTMGDDQFNPAHEENVYAREVRARDSYYELLHYFITVATITAICIPPVLRMQVQCNGRLYCYPLAFGVPAASLLLAIIILISGSKSLYKKSPGNCWIVDYVSVLGRSVSNKASLQSESSQDLIYDLRIVKHILALYIPLPFFWALYEQMGSRWVYQATRMKTTVNYSHDLYLEPDQMQVLNPIFTLILLPLLEYFLYPVLRRIGCSKLLRPQMRMYTGGVLAIFAFIAAALVEYRLEPTHAIVPRNGEGELWFINTLNGYNTSFITSIVGYEETIVTSMDMVRVPNIPVTGVVPFTFTMFWDHPRCLERDESLDPYYPHWLIEEKVIAIMMSPWIYVPSLIVKGEDYDHTADDYFLEECASRQGPIMDLIFTNPDRCDLQLPRVGLVYFTRRLSLTRKDDQREDFSYPDSFVLDLVDLRNLTSGMTKFLDPNHNGIDFFHMYASTYAVTGGKQTIDRPVADFQISLRRGGVYMLYYVFDSRYPFLANMTTIVKPNSETIWFQLPQYVLMSLAQYLYPLTLLEYSLTQVPVRLKPVLITFWLLTIALGNFVVAIFSFPHVFNRDLNNYVMFIMLMVVDQLLLMVVLWNYVPVSTEEDGGSEPDSPYGSDLNFQPRIRPN